jgi:hypothetical protein
MDSLPCVYLSVLRKGCAVAKPAKNAFNRTGAVR